MAAAEAEQAYIRYEKKGGVAEVVLARGKQYNKMDEDFFNEFHEAITQADQDSDIRVILIWAEGTLFTAGLDLMKAGPALSTSETKGAEANLELYNLVKSWQKSFSSLQKTNKPVIAAVHGKCIGGGVDLITAADIRLASKDASFSVLETKLAIVADLGTLQRISRIVGRGYARELVLTSQYITAERAHHMGLVNRIYEDKEKLLAASRAMAEEIAGLSPLVVQASKKIMNFSEDHTEKEGLEHVALWNTSFLKSADLGEAVKAFIEKRPPVFISKL